MTLTAREYLHQHFGPKDRRWIESLSDNRCWAVSWDLVQLGASGVHGMRQIGGERPTYEIMMTEDLHPLPDVPGEYPNWR